MFLKDHRLPSSEIKNVLRSKNRASGRELQLVFQKNNLSVSRFAVIVGTNIDKRATARNRTKRLIRESVRLLSPHIAGGWDTVIIVRKAFEQMKQPQVQKILEETFSHGNLLNNLTI